MIPLLISHQKVGIDFDGTLIEHPRSRLLQRFILANRDKEFHIVSFRSHGMEKNIERDLRISTLMTQVPLGLQHFTGVHNVPDALYEGWAMFGDADQQKVKDYLCWKATKCRELGCTIIVDDMSDVGPHCEEIGIRYLHPDNL
jgi:hypothetical protein